MSDKSGISWLKSRGEEGRLSDGATWNFANGCHSKSEGCGHCWARALHTSRFEAKKAGKNIKPAQYDQPFDVVQLMPERLTDPLRWQRPRRIFPLSMSDFFHTDIPRDMRDEACAVILLSPRHTFITLTKRAEEMHDYFMQAGRSDRWVDALRRIATRERITLPDPETLVQEWPEHWWPGVTVENQKNADLRIPLLLDLGARYPTLSCEPLLGPVNLQAWMSFDVCDEQCRPEHYGTTPDEACCGCEALGWTRHSECHAWMTSDIGWVIVGGESGKDARRMREEWALDLRDQCHAARIPFHFKQWGRHNADGTQSALPHGWSHRTLAGVEYDQSPGDRLPTTPI